MKKYYSIFTMTLCLVVVSLAIIGCEKINDILAIEQITDIGGAGSYKVTNNSTGESVEVNGALFSYGSLTAHKGETIRIEFIKAEKYSKYDFTTKYTLHDGTVVENENPYEYVIPVATTPGVYDISFSAKSTEQQISSSGSLKIIIVE